MLELQGSGNQLKLLRQPRDLINNFLNCFILVDFNREQAKAKQCLNKLIASDCDFTPAIQEVFDLSLNDHNPFCADNRDPGATGKGQCESVQDPNKTFSDDKSAGFKSGLSPAILLCFVSFLFFVKF